MFGLGFGELLAIGIVLFVFFGAKRLPQLGSSLAQGIRNFQKGLSGQEDKKELDAGQPSTTNTSNPKTSGDDQSNQS